MEFNDFEQAIRTFVENDNTNGANANLEAYKEALRGSRCAAGANFYGQNGWRGNESDCYEQTVPNGTIVGPEDAFISAFEGGEVSFVSFADKAVVVVIKVDKSCLNDRLIPDILRVSEVIVPENTHFSIAFTPKEGFSFQNVVSIVIPDYASIN
ncbi:hypothetical protein DTO169E5_7581 [Paecilomyces variotii]|nr:hypothetical protein DTO169E5_7581 [Paecilomyces variotii]